METILGRYKNLIVLAAILFAQIIGLAIQVKLPAQDGPTRLIRLWAAGAVTPFEKAVVHSQNWFSDTWHGYVYLRSVHKENQQLRDQIDRMKLDEVRLSEDAKMARRVQALLAFKEQYVDTTVAAQVIGNSGSEQSRVIYLDKGSHDGIKTDMAVITPTGIVGKIVQVFPDSSQVLPINDQLSGVGAALKDTRLQGILKGSGNGATTLQYVMSDEKVSVGEDVITSGGDRIFPKGLPVGKVASVAPGKDLFLDIRVVPSSRLDRLEEVLIVTKMLEKPPDTKDLGPIRAADILAERLPTVPPQPSTDAAGNVAPGGTPNTGGTTAGTLPKQPTTKPTIVPSGAITPAARATTPGANRAVKPPPAAGVSTAGYSTTTIVSPSPADSGVKSMAPKSVRTTAPGTQTPATDAGLSSTLPPQRPVKKVIVEADPEPSQKPVRKTPPETNPSTPAPNSAPQTEGTNPQR